MRKNARIAILVRLLPKGIVGLSRKQDRGPGIDKVTDFHQVLSFAFPTGISWDGRRIFKVDLHFLQRVTRLHRLMLAWHARQDIAVLA